MDMKKKAYLRTIEVTIAVIITFAVAYFIMPRASVTVDDVKISVLPTLEQNQGFRDCVMQLNYNCVNGYLRNFVPQNYDFTFDITEDPNTPHQGLPDKRISTESIYLAGTNNPQAANRDGLVLAYNFDVNSSPCFFPSYCTKDLSDFGNDGTLFFDPPWVAEGYYGHSYYFDGSGYSYIGAFSNNLRLNFPVTIIAWIKKNGDGIILATDSPSYQYGVSIYVESSKLVANFNNGLGDYNRKTGNTILQNGVWYGVAAVVRGNNDIDLYVNGVNDGGVYSGSATAVQYSNPGAWISQSGGSSFTGHIGPVRIYNRALSASEIGNMNVVPTEINLYNPKIIKVYYWRKE